jgi:hypothetical protein
VYAVFYFLKQCEARRGCPDLQERKQRELVDDFRRRDSSSLSWSAFTLLFYLGLSVERERVGASSTSRNASPPPARSARGKGGVA